MVLTSGYTLLEMLANKYQNQSSFVFCGLQLGDFGVLWRCKPQIVTHSPVRVFYMGFLCGLHSASSCCSFLLNSSTLCRASQLSGIHARLSVMQLYLGAGESGTGRWAQELIERDCCCSYDIACCCYHQKDGNETRSVFTCSCFMAGSFRPTVGPYLSWTQCVCLHGASSSWKSFLHENCSRELPSGRVLWIS